MLSRYTAQVAKRQDIAPDTFLFKLKMPAEFNFLPGQFLMADFGRNTKGVLVRRAYSMASPLSELPYVDLAVRTSNNSKSLPFWQKLTAGQELAVEGPSGLFVYQPSGRRKLFLAGGVGIAPIRCMIKSWAEAGDGSQAVLIYGAADKQHLVYEDEFLTLAKKNPRFKLTMSLENPDGTDYPDGYPTDRLANISPNPSTDIAYLCGPPPMVATAEEKLQALGFTPDLIKKERF